MSFGVVWCQVSSVFPAFCGAGASQLASAKGPRYDGTWLATCCLSTQYHARRLTHWPVADAYVSH